jgi:rhamnosyltransferase
MDNEKHSSKPVAVIMRSKNEQPYAEKTLESLFQQTYTGFTLYNVDSGSTDGTLESIRRHNLLTENIFEIFPKDYIPGRVLNTMIARTNEPVTVLLNADCVPLNHFWLERLLAPIFDDKADAVSSRQVARRDAYSIVQFDYERAFGSANMHKRNDPFFSAAACAFKRELWMRHPFPQSGWGEDFAWAIECQRLGGRFDLVRDSVVEHSHNYPLQTLYKREYGHGIVYHQVLGQRPSLLWESLACAKHIARDTLYALRRHKFADIPFNMLYRMTFDWAHYRGRCTGAKNQGFPDDFFRR